MQEMNAKEEPNQMTLHQTGMKLLIYQPASQFLQHPVEYITSRQPEEKKGIENKLILQKKLIKQIHMDSR